MSNYVYNSLRSEQSQIDTLLEVLEEALTREYLTEAEKEAVQALDSFEDFCPDTCETLAHLDHYAAIETVRDRIMESVLEVSTITTKRILLGCGGPTRYIEIDFDEDGTVNGGRYYDNEGAMNDKSVEVERCLNLSEAEAFACRYGLGEG